ncbi:MAG: CHAT domain-containing protein [Planctomycetota bacterium]
MQRNRLRNGVLTGLLVLIQSPLVWEFGTDEAAVEASSTAALHELGQQGQSSACASGSSLIDSLDELLSHPPGGVPADLWGPLDTLCRCVRSDRDFQEDARLVERCLRQMATHLDTLATPGHRGFVVTQMERIARSHGALALGTELFAEREDPANEPLEVLRLHARYSKARLMRLSRPGAPAAMAIHEEMIDSLVPNGDDDAFSVSMRGYLQDCSRQERILCLLDLGLVREAAKLVRRVDPEGTSLESAVVDLLRGQYRAARAKYESQLSRTQTPANRAVRLVRYAEALSGLGEMELAVAALSEALDEPSLGAEARAGARVDLARLRLRMGESDLARAELERIDRSALVPLNRVRFALLRERCENDQVNSERRLADVRNAFVDWIARWAESPLTEQGIEFLDSRLRAPVLAQVIEAEIQRGDGEQRALKHLIHAQSCGTLARRLRLGHLDTDILRAHLGATEAGLLAVVPGDDRAIVFLVDGSGATSYTVSASRIRRFDSEITQIFDGRTAEAAAEFTERCRVLADELIPREVRARVLKWRSIRVTGLAQVASLSPELLRLDGDWLGTRIPCATWPSIVVGHFLETERNSPAEGMHALIATDVSGETLAFSPSDWTALESAFGGPQAVRRDAEAVLDSVPTGRLDLLYIHCHGGLDLSVPRPSILRLADSVDARKIERTWDERRSARVVVLAACRAGREERRLGEDGASSLTGAFFVAGTATVLAAREDLYHEPAKALIRSFSHHLGEGHFVGEALRRARARLLADGFDPRDVGVMSLFGAIR